MPIVDLTTPTTRISAATQDKDGLMSATDKTKLDGIGLATSETAGMVKPDNQTITAQNGVLTAVSSEAQIHWIDLEDLQ